MPNVHIVSGSSIGLLRLHTLISAAKLEVLGIRKRGPSAHSILKRELGIKGNRKSVIEQAEACKRNVANW